MNKRIVKLIAEIDEFKGFWKGMERLTSETLSNLRVFATIESIGSSTRIEGAKLSDREVAALLEGIDTRSFRSRDEQEVAGYADAMRLIHKSYPEIDLTENNIKYLHKSLMRYSVKDAWHLGEYKKHPNHVAMFDEDGNEIGIIFETTSPFETPAKMKKLVESIRLKMNDNSEHPLVVISDFVVRFLAIHPFQDGNGRLSRAISNLLLLQFGYSYIPYVSFEEIIEDKKIDYYIALRTTQKNHKTKKEDITPWINFMLDIMILQTEKAKKLLQNNDPIKILSAKQLAIYELFNDQEELNVSKITELLKIKSPLSSVKQAVFRLFKLNLIERIGEGRGVRYKKL